MAKTRWLNIQFPFEMYEMHAGKAIIFKFRGGAWEGYSFVRPTSVVRRGWEGDGGFAVGFAITQELDANGDVISEGEEPVTVKKSEKDENGRWSVIDEQEVLPSQLEDMLKQ